MRPYRIVRLIASALVAISAMIASVGSPPRLTRAAAAPLCGGTVQNVSGTIAANTTWSPTNIYVLTGNVTVNTGITLVIQPGTVIKARLNAAIYVDGTLNANGTTANPIYFTSEKDDTICGDTNADGATTLPTVGDWAFIEFEGGSNETSSVSRAVLRYGGNGYAKAFGSAILCNTGPIRLRNVAPTLTSLSMERNTRNAVGLAGGQWNAHTLASTTVVYWLESNVEVLANQTFTINPGVKLKAPALTSLYISGKLIADGTPSTPIYFTSEKDDTVCGYGANDELVCDTNNAVDGPTTGDWGFIEFEGGSNETSSLSRAVLRYGGNGYAKAFGSAILCNTGPIRLRNVAPTLTALSMERNTRNAVGLAGGQWNAHTLASTTVVYWLESNVEVLANQTFTIMPGTKFKAPANTSLYISGKLIADGAAATDATPAMPITFTSEKDDTVCGVGASNEQVCDTDNAVDGPAIGDWGFIEFEGSSNYTSSISRAVLRYGGNGYALNPGYANFYNSGAIRLRGTSPTISYNSFQQNYIGVDLNSGAQPTLTCNDFASNQAFGIRNNQPTTVVSATLQWWNSASGPTHSANVGGTGEKVSDGIAYSPWANTACAPTVPVTTTPWLVLLYMAGDNSGTGSVSLSPPMRELLTRLGSMAYNPNMRLVVLFDGDNASGGDTHIYTREQSGMVDVTEEAAKNWLGGMGGSSGARELDTGSASSLSTFVNWATMAYPGATHTMLSVVDHGGGWAPSIGLPGQPRGGKNVQAGSWRGMNLDLTSVGGSSLATRDLGQALRNTVHLDVLVLDACLMGMLENAYELRNYADYLVSGENVLFADLPYEAYLASDGLTATTSPLGLARRIVTNYNTGANLQEQPFAMSVTDLRQLRDGVAGSLPTLLNTLATKMLLALPAAPTDSDPLVLALTQIYSQTQKFDYDSSMAIEPHEGYVDLVDFASKLRDSTNAAIPADVRTAAGDLVAAATTGPTPVIDTNRVISGNYNSTAWNLNAANGLSIFLPLGEQDYRPSKADPNDSTKSLAERQLKYYADPSQLMLTHDVPQWAALLVRLEPTVPIIRTGPGGLPTTAAVSLAAAPSIDTRAFTTPGQVIPVVGPSTYSISGSVRDASNAGVSGVTVSAGTGYSTTTAADGSYTIGSLPTGSYTLTLSLSGYTFNPPSKQVTVTANMTAQDFTATRIIITYSISGSVRDASNAGVSGVTVSAGTGYSTTTAADGSYTIGSLPTGSYTLTLSLSGYTFNPPSKQVTVTANMTAQDFAAIRIDTKSYVYLPLIQR